MSRAVFIAPLAGVSNIPFRLSVLRYSSPVQYTEMVMAKALFCPGSRSMAMLDRAPEEKQLGAQLLGNDPETMARAARLVEEKGFDRVDMNFGCPVRKVVVKGTGAAMLKDPPAVRRVMAAVRAAVKIPVSAKVRTGWTRRDETAVEIARMAEGEGLSHITVHGRPWQKTPGHPVDYETLSRVKQAVTIPVIGNGGIFSAADALRMIDLTGVDGVMLARGAMGHPWLAREVRAAFDGVPCHPLSARERVEGFRFHLDKILQYLPERDHLNHLKKAATWYLHGFARNKYIRMDLYAARTAADFMRIFEREVESADLELAPNVDPEFHAHNENWD